MTQHQGSTSAGSGPTGGRRHDGNADHLKREAGKLGEQVGEEARSEFERQKRSAAGKAEALADTMRDAAERLEGDDRQLSHLVSGIASSLGELADGMRNKSADELLRDVRRIARDNPTLMIAGSVAIGFGLVRFARASSHRRHDEGEHLQRGATGSARSVSPMGMGSESGNVTEWSRNSDEPDAWHSEPMHAARTDRPGSAPPAGSLAASRTDPSIPVTDRPLTSGAAGTGLGTDRGSSSPAPRGSTAGTLRGSGGGASTRSAGTDSWKNTGGESR